MSIRPIAPATPAADAQSPRAEARAAHRRRLARIVAQIVLTASAVVVVGAVVTGYLAVVGTGGCERDEAGSDICVRRAWWPFTIAQRAEHWTVDGVPDGPRIEWHANGERWIVGAYDDGARVGPWREFWPDGTLRFAGTYVDDRLEGEEAWFFADGTPEWSVRRRAGVRVGVERWYWPNGVLRRQGQFLDGEKQGRFVSTDDMGVVVAVREYQRGVEVGR